MISHQPIPFGDKRMFHYFREDWEELSETQSVDD